MKNETKEEKIANWKQLILDNPKRLQEEKEVIQKYGTLFNPSNLSHLKREDFKSFLLFKNNKHWEAIHRQGNIITADMKKLRKGLRILLDETKDIQERLNFLFPSGKSSYIKGLGRAVVTPILLVVYPKKYGVWNSKSEEGLRKMGLFPYFARKDSFAKKYIEVNKVLNELASRYKVTLWQLDEIVGCIALGHSPISADSDVVSETKEVPESYEEFGLESHLEDFLVENWEKLTLGKKYSILEEEGDIIGQQYITPVGRIDILAKGKSIKEWLVIELKKGKSGDQVVGQILRYIAWVKENLAELDDKVKGLIVVGEADDKLRYSLKTVANIDLMTYSVNFTLHKEKK